MALTSMFIFRCKWFGTGLHIPAMFATKLVPTVILWMFVTALIKESVVNYFCLTFKGSVENPTPN